MGDQRASPLPHAGGEVGGADGVGAPDNPTPALRATPPASGRGEEPTVTLDAFLGQPDATAVRLEAGEDARALLPHLDHLQLIEIAFPSFRDGRGYSAARILREAGYRGELRAQGDVLADQIGFMKRCGFDSFAPEAQLDEALAEASLARFAHVYQRAADDAVPVWKLRHG